ncbi:YMR226C, partial [Symbiodinium microadriaticum]
MAMAAPSALYAPLDLRGCSVLITGATAGMNRSCYSLAVCGAGLQAGHLRTAWRDAGGAEKTTAGEVSRAPSSDHGGSG